MGRQTWVVNFTAANHQTEGWVGSWVSLDKSLFCQELRPSNLVYNQSLYPPSSNEALLCGGTAWQHTNLQIQFHILKYPSETFSIHIASICVWNIFTLTRKINIPLESEGFWQWCATLWIITIFPVISLQHSLISGIYTQCPRKGQYSGRS
jgi:hypothetical protein